MSRDIVSEVFARIWKRRDSLVLDSLNAYLYVSVRNLCLDHLKAERRKTDFEKEFCCSMEDFEVDDFTANQEQQEITISSDQGKPTVVKEPSLAFGSDRKKTVGNGATKTKESKQKLLTLTTPRGKDYQVTLADGTKVCSRHYL